MIIMKKAPTFVFAVVPHYSGNLFWSHVSEEFYWLFSFSLFSSKTKYESGSGWPSFYMTLKNGNNTDSVERITDLSHAMVRVEVVCNNVTKAN